MNAARSLRPLTRSHLVNRVRRELEARGWPRVQMSLLVLLTGGVGFLASFSLLRLGADSLALRYPLAVGIAYCAFLLLLWMRLHATADDVEDLGEAVLEAIPEDITYTARVMKGGGGEFGGAGATARWEPNTESEPLVELPDVEVPGIDAVADAEEAAIPLAVILFVAGLVLALLAASVSIVFSAPVLFAEMLVDGVLVATLYRRLRHLDQRHWLQSAVRRTVVPFALTALIASAVGWGLSVYAPGAKTLGDAISHAGNT